jgi:hypothetical protein
MTPATMGRKAALRPATPPRDAALRKLARWFNADSFMYVIGHGDVVKIGRSGDPQRRFGQIQQTCPVPLTIYAIVPEFHTAEEAAHEQWSHLRAHGEWFRRTPELDEWISGLRDLYERRERVRQRLVDLLERRRAPFRSSRLYRLQLRETHMASVRQKADLQQIREDEAARGCRLCPAEYAPQHSPHLAGSFCKPCAAWLAKINRFSCAEVQLDLQKAAHEARQKLAQHEARTLRLSQIRRDVATQRGSAVFDWTPGTTAGEP